MTLKLLISKGRIIVCLMHYLDSLLMHTQGRRANWSNHMLFGWTSLLSQQQPYCRSPWIHASWTISKKVTNKMSSVPDFYLYNAQDYAGQWIVVYGIMTHYSLSRGSTRKPFLTGIRFPGPLQGRKIICCSPWLLLLAEYVEEPRNFIISLDVLIASEANPVPPILLAPCTPYWS